MRYCLLLLMLAALPWAASAQPTAAQPAAPQPATAQSAASVLVTAVPREQHAELWFSNRLILTYRAAVLPRSPTERAEAARQTLSRLVEENVTGPVASRELLGASIITVAGRDVFGIVPEDVGGDEVDLPTLTTAAIGRVQQALAEATEARNPARIAAAAGRSLLATMLLAIALVILGRLSRWMTARLLASAEALLLRSRVGADLALLRATRLLDVARGAAKFVVRALSAGALYVWVGYVLLQFPLTRPWGEGLRGFLFTTLTQLGLGALYALPGLFTAAIIFLVARFVVRLTTLLFEAIADGRIDMPAIGGAKAAPTRRLITTLVWVFALVVAYPYLPGSDTDAFKGVSVFFGLVVSLGSSGFVNQVMSGFMITYTGALEPGDYAKIGDVEGTVTQLGVMSTKVRTRRNEEVTIPNAVVSAGITVNYSRNQAQGVFGATSVTIGYDVPWRQVEAMLLTAAARTPGIRREIPPVVLQTDLADFYVEYTLLVCLDDPATRVPTLSAVRAHIQDVFNEHGVQIMSPNYEADPAERKIVPRDRWFAPPATPAGPPTTPQP